MADRRQHDRRDARRRAHLDHVADQTDGSAGEARRERQRDEAVRAAAARPSAARWLVDDLDAAPGAGGRPLDVVADLLGLDPRTRLRGRGDADLRELARRVDHLVGIAAATPSGRPLLDVVVSDEETREALAPALDLEALLADVPTSPRSHDRTVRLAEALLARAAEHRDGAIDLHALVAPVGVDRHPAADEIEAIVHVATEHVTIPANSAPAVAMATGGWVAASPVELFLTAARGLLDGTAAAVGGAMLYRWLSDVAQDPADPWWLTLVGILEVRVDELIQPAAARAGSDHPDVAGSVLTEMIALRHPLL